MERKPKIDPLADEPLLRRARRLSLEARRIGAATVAQNERIAALVAELSEVHRAMIEGSEDIKREADAVVRHTAVAAAYARAANTLKPRRSRH